MLRQDITYTDHNNKKRSETIYFNLNEMEVIDLELNTPGGLEKKLQDAVDAVDHREILNFIKLLISLAYGEKSEDGRHFRKEDPVTGRPLVKDFQSAAYYSDFLFGLFENNGVKGVEFVKGVLPAGLVKSATEKANNLPRSVEPSARERWDQRQAAKNIPSPTFEDASSFEESSAARVEVVPPTEAPLTHEVTPQERLAREQDPLSDGRDEWNQEEYEAFKAWKASQNEEGSISRPPHESGPGAQFNG